MAWRQLPRPPWPFPATRNDCLNALKQLGLKLGNNKVMQDDRLNQRELNQAQKLKRDTIDAYFSQVIGQCCHAFKSRQVSDLHSIITTGAAEMDQRAQITSAGAMKAVRYLTGHGEQNLAEQLFVQLASMDTDTGIPTQYEKVLGVLLQDLAQKKEYINILKLSSKIMSSKLAGHRLYLSNAALQAIFESALHLGDKDVLLKSWNALVGDRSMDKARPSLGTFVAFLEACIAIDSQELQHSLFGTDTCTKQALHYAEMSSIPINNAIASLLFTHCSSADDISHVMKLHLSSQGIESKAHVNTGREYIETLMLEVLEYANSVKLTSKLAACLIRGLMKCDLSGEAFALLSYPRLKSGAAAPRKYQSFADEEPFNVLIHHSTNVGGLWPVFKALEITSHAWHAPSKRSVESLLYKLSCMEDDNLSKDLLDDLLSVFKDTQTTEANLDTKGIKVFDPDSTFISNMSHIRVNAIWDIWQRYCLPHPSKKSIKSLICCLHRAHASDTYLKACLYSTLASISQNMLLSAADQKELRSEIVLTLLQDDILRKDVAIKTMSWLADKGTVLKQSAIEKGATALDSRDRVSHLGNVQRMMKLAVISDSLTKEFETNMQSAVLRACEASENSTLPGEIDVLSQEKIVGIIESKFKALRKMRDQDMDKLVQELKTFEAQR